MDIKKIDEQFQIMDGDTVIAGPFDSKSAAKKEYKQLLKKTHDEVVKDRSVQDIITHFDLAQLYLKHEENPNFEYMYHDIGDSNSNVLREELISKYPDWEYLGTRTSYEGVRQQCFRKLNEVAS